MQYEFLRHSNSFKILTITDLPQHVRYASRTRLLKRRQYANKMALNDSFIGCQANSYLRPYPIDLLLHPYLFALQSESSLYFFLFSPCRFRNITSRNIGTGRPPWAYLDIPELKMKHTTWVRKQKKKKRTSYPSIFCHDRNEFHTNLVNHITFRMPTLISVIPVYLYKLLQDSTIATGTFCSKPSRIMKMTIHIILMFVVRVLRAKNSRANRTREMLNMIFFICS